jgi:hypothetical protein
MGTQSLSRIEKHQAKSADGGVETGVLDLQRLAVGRERVHIVMTGSERVLPAELKDAGRQIGREHIAGWSDALRDIECLVTRAGRNVEYPLAGADVGHLEHGVRGCSQPAVDFRAFAVP